MMSADLDSLYQWQDARDKARRSHEKGLSSLEGFFQQQIDRLMEKLSPEEKKKAMRREKEKEDD